MWSGSLLFCLINLSPNNYKLVVKQLWETGVTRIGELEIKPAKGGYVRVKKFYDGELPKIHQLIGSH